MKKSTKVIGVLALGAAAIYLYKNNDEERWKRNTAKIRDMINAGLKAGGYPTLEERVKAASADMDAEIQTTEDPSAQKDNPPHEMEENYKEVDTTPPERKIQDTIFGPRFVETPADSTFTEEEPEAANTPDLYPDLKEDLEKAREEEKREEEVPPTSSVPVEEKPEEKPEEKQKEVEVFEAPTIPVIQKEDPKPEDVFTEEKPDAFSDESMAEPEKVTEEVEEKAAENLVDNLFDAPMREEKPIQSDLSSVSSSEEPIRAKDLIHAEKIEATPISEKKEEAPIKAMSSEKEIPVENETPAPPMQDLGREKARREEKREEEKVMQQTEKLHKVEDANPSNFKTVKDFLGSLFS